MLKFTGVLLNLLWETEVNWFSGNMILIASLFSFSHNYEEICFGLSSFFIVEAAWNKKKSISATSSLHRKWRNTNFAYLQNVIFSIRK